MHAGRQPGRHVSVDLIFLRRCSGKKEKGSTASSMCLLAESATKDYDIVSNTCLKNLQLLEDILNMINCLQR